MRAKYFCESVTDFGYNRIEVSLSAICDDDTEENKKFNQATPRGTLKMMIDNPEAKDYFKPSKGYYLDFTEVNV